MERMFKNKIKKIFLNQANKLKAKLLKYMKEKKDDNDIDDEEAEKQAEEITAAITAGVLTDTGVQTMMKELLPLWLDCGKIGNDFFNQIQFTKPENGTVFAVINDDYLTWLQSYGGEQIKHINDTTQNIVQDVIKQGLLNGDGISKIADDLVEQISEYSKSRAMTIARTEVHNSFCKGNFDSASASGFKNKTWQTMEDQRVRPAHAAIDGTTVKIDEDFLPGLAYPGDSRASGNLTINCRCILTYS